VHASPLRPARPEAFLEVRDEVARRADTVLELGGQLHEPTEVRLTDELPLAELLRRPLDPARVARVPAHRRRNHRRRAELAQPLQELPRRLA
jgi:hypothetical protein